MVMSQIQDITFHKMHGCGNDFALIDNRGYKVPVEHMAAWARIVCPRAFSVGADGLIFLEEAPTGTEGSPSYRWHFYNADGSRAEMCGNASRCAARLAVELGIAPEKHSFLTDAGVIRAQLLDADTVRVQLTDPQGMVLDTALDVAGDALHVHFVDSGVPHAVIFVDDAKTQDIKRLGPALRYHEHFAPKGTNANIAQIKDTGSLYLRTYERGVEGETHACGTGAVAASLLANALGLTGEKVGVTTSGGEQLTVELENGKVFLTGKAVKVYTGTLQPAVLGLPC